MTTVGILLLTLLLLVEVCKAKITPTRLRALDSLQGRASFYEFSFVSSLETSINTNGVTGGVLITFPPEIPGSLMNLPVQCYHFYSQVPC